MQYNRHGIGHEHLHSHNHDNNHHIISTIKRHKYELIGVIGLVMAFILVLIQ